MKSIKTDDIETIEIGTHARAGQTSLKFVFEKTKTDSIWFSKKANGEEKTFVLLDFLVEWVLNRRY